MGELDQIRARTGGCETGDAVVTGAGLLPAKFVFHAVGPIYRGGNHDEARLLASCYSKCLELAAARQLRVISFPSISTGVYGYPVEDAAEIAVRTVTQWVQENPGAIRTVKLVQFSEADHQVYIRHAQALRSAPTAARAKAQSSAES